MRLRFDQDQLQQEARISMHKTNNSPHLSIIVLCVFTSNFFRGVSSNTSCAIMWSNLPSDLLANIFSYLPPHSFARAIAVCHHWHDCAWSTTTRHHHHPPWFIALPTRTSSRSSSCLVHNPVESTWHFLDLEFVSGLTRPISTIGEEGLILFKATGGVPLQLSICNPFTGNFKHLPPLQKNRTNPAVGIIEICPNQFKIYVAGGMLEAASGGAASYEPTFEIFDSKINNWVIMGSMPVEFAVRLTVWTPNESVYSGGVLYWMTSARAYSIMGYEMGVNKWREFSVPMGDTLEFAALVPHDKKLAVIGGTLGGDVTVWELGEGGEWNIIERMPIELGKRFIGGNTKCVGIKGGVCLYKEIASRMVFWRKNGDKNGRWEWCWIEGCNSIKGKQLQNFPIKGLFLHPNLVGSSFVF